MKRILSILWIIVLIFSLSACNGKTLDIKTVYDNIPAMKNHGERLDGNILVTVAQNDNFSLSVNPENGQFEVLNLKDGYIYSSCPAGIDEDTLTIDPVKNQAKSVMKITYGDTINRITGEAVSYTDSVLSGGHSCFKFENGFLSLYNFQAASITVPMLVTLNEDGVDIQILTADVEEKGNYILTDVSLATHFGAGNLNETGYIVVPDGSGAVIEFNNGKHEYPSLMLPMYGTDVSVADFGIENTRAYLPIFGVKRENHGYLAIINKGDAHSTVNATVAGGTNSYNNAYASFAVRDRAVVGISATSAGYANKSSILFDERTQSLNSVGVKYILLGENESNYSSMAKKYGEYLAKTYGMDKSTYKFTETYFNAYCSAKVDKSVFGIKTTDEITLFDFESINNAITDLYENGKESISVFLNGRNKSELEGDFKKSFSPLKNLGKTEEFKALLENAAKKGISVYGMSDIFEVKPSNSFSARKINRKKLELYPISLNTLKPDELKNPFSFISPSKLFDFCEDVVDGAVEHNMGFGVSLSKTVLYSDFGDDYSKRQQTAKYISEFFERSAEKGISLSAEQPTAYVVPYLDRVLYPGGNFAHYDIEDYQIPFYQLAISEYIAYSGEAVNLSLDSENAVMRTMEYGGGLLYSLIDKNGDIVFKSDRSELYNCEYNSLKDNIENNSKIINEFYAKTGSVLMAHTRLKKDIYISEYTDANAVFNYSNEDFVFGDVTVKANSFEIIEKKAVLENE